MQTDIQALATCDLSAGIASACSAGRQKPSMISLCPAITVNYATESESEM